MNLPAKKPTTNKATVRERFPEVMPFVDEMRALFGNDLKITHIKNNETGEEMETRDNIEPPNSLDSSQWLKLGEFVNVCDRDVEKAVKNGRK
jgi:hypothetical protein